MKASNPWKVYSSIWRVRAGINSITQGQTYAAMAIGLRPAQVYRYVLLPVSYRIIIPPLTSDFLGDDLNFETLRFHDPLDRLLVGGPQR